MGGVEAAALQERPARVDDRDVVADVAGQAGDGGGEVDGAEHDQARRRGVGQHEHPQVVAHGRAVAAVAADHGHAAGQQPDRLAADRAVQEVGDAELAREVVLDHRQPAAGVGAVQQRGDGRRPAVGLGQQRRHQRGRVVLGDLGDEDAHGAATHQPDVAGQLVRDAVGLDHGLAAAEHALGLLDQRSLDAAAGDRALDRAVGVDEHGRAGVERRRAQHLDEDRGGEPAPLGDPAQHGLAGLGFRIHVSSFGRPPAARSAGPRR